MLNGFLKFVSGKWTNTTVSEVNPLPVNIVSPSNPLPIASPMATSGNLEAIAGRVHLLRASQAALAAQYARIQIRTMFLLLICSHSQVRQALTFIQRMRSGQSQEHCLRRQMLI